MIYIFGILIFTICLYSAYEMDKQITAKEQDERTNEFGREDKV